MHGYAVQPSAGMVKLDTMENPFRLPTGAAQALGERLAEVALNRYPAERGDVLRAALAAHASMPSDCDIMLGNGSDELISLLAMACDVPGDTSSRRAGLRDVPDVGQAAGPAFVGVPLTADFELDLPAMLAAIASTSRRSSTSPIRTTRPPTCGTTRRSTRSSTRAPGLVVMDEAYQPFAARDSMARLKRHAHVLLMRTMSKFGLAGVRIGYLIGARR
jgi:histidinol-phosphate aminotransferase